MDYHLSHLPEVRAAIAAAATCSTIEELTAAIHAFDKHPCARRPAMPGRPGSRFDPARPRAMILGKSPAATETETRVPFSGPAGQVLREEMDLAGLDLETCWITGATPWPAKDNTPNATQLAVSRPFLFREIEIVRPAVIVCLGQKADEALRQKAETLGERPGTHWTLTLGDHACTVALTHCHGWISYGRAERAPTFRRHLEATSERHPEALRPIREAP